MANQIGKIYVCTQCGAQVIVTKGGAGAIKCCNVEMQQKK
jgi:DNA-directed RNA polymerase subunit RPC12/RpoP